MRRGVWMTAAACVALVLAVATGALIWRHDDSGRAVVGTWHDGR
ncbi:hypothetical protein [Mangrovihabitans endophyticus]|nr:hypothetical protein [Mangrovihabitans endophyticus]